MMWINCFSRPRVLALLLLTAGIVLAAPLASLAQTAIPPQVNPGAVSQPFFMPYSMWNWSTTSPYYYEVIPPDGKGKEPVIEYEGMDVTGRKLQKGMPFPTAPR